MIQALNADPVEGAKQFRDMSKEILKDAFYADLDDIPGVPVQEETTQEEETKEEDPVSLTPEQMQKILDDRDAKAKADATAAAEEAARDAAIEEVFAEIEAAGFARGSEEFMTALALGQTLSAQGKDVVFADLAPKVRLVHDLPEPEAPPAEEASNEAPAPAPATVGTVVDGSGKEFPLTAGAGGAGTAAEPATDWVAEAKAAGRNVMEVARERAEARISG